MSYASTILADSPISLWMLNETSGSSAADSADSNTGTYAGTVTLNQSTGLKGVTTSISLNGNNANYVLLKSAKLVSGLTNATVEFWFKTSISQVAFMTLYCEQGTSGALWRLAMAGTTGGNTAGTIQFAKIADDGVVVAGTCTNAFNDGAWHHLALVKSGTAITLYVDCVSQLTVTDTGNSTFANGSIETRAGSDKNDPTIPYNGSVAAVAVYNTALSASQVLSHYLAGIFYPVASNAFGFVGATSGSNSNLSAISLTRSVTAGNVIINILGTNQTGFNPLSGMTDSQNNTYYLISSQSYGSWQGRVYITVASATGSLTVTGHSNFGGAGGLWFGTAEYKGITPIGLVSGGTVGGGTGNWPLPSVTTTVTTQLILAAFGSDFSSSTFTPTGYTIDYRNAVAVVLYANESKSSGTVGGETINGCSPAAGETFTVIAFPLAPAAASFPILLALV